MPASVAQAIGAPERRHVAQFGVESGAVDRVDRVVGHYGFHVSAVLVVPLILLSPALRPGWVLSCADVLLESYLYASVVSGEFEPHNRLISDAHRQFVPWQGLIAEELREGRLPFWNPYAGGGSPLLGNAQSAVFDPLSAPMLFVDDAPQATVWIALLRMWVAGLGGFFLARRLGATSMSATVAGVMVGCGGYMVLRLLSPHSSSSAWVPWSLLAAELLVTTGDRRAAVALAVTLTLSVFGGHVEVAFFSAVGASLYALLRRGQLAGWTVSAIRPLLGAVGAVALLTVALSAVQVFPFLEALEQGSVVEHRQELAETGELQGQFRWERIPMHWFPYLFGRPLRDEVALWTRNATFNLQTATYVSVLGITLAVIGMTAAARRSPARAMTVLGVLYLAFTIQLPGLAHLLARVPVVGWTPPTRSGQVVVVCFAVLAALGLDACQSASRRFRFAGRFALALAVAAGLGLLGSVWLFAGAPGHQTWTGWVLGVLAPWTHGAGQEASVMAGFEQIAPTYASSFVLPWCGIAFVSALVLRGLGRSKSSLRGGRILQGAGAYLVITVDLLYFGLGYNPSLPLVDVFPETPATQALRSTAGRGRVLTLHNGWPANVATHYRTADMLGYDVIGRERWERLLGLAGPFRRLSSFRHPESWVHDLVGVRAVTTPTPIESDTLQTTARFEGAVVYENAQAFPPAFLHPRIRVVADIDEAERALSEVGFDPRHTLVVEAPGWEPLAGETSEDRRVVRAGLTRQGAGELEIHLSAPYTGMLVVSENFDPAWRVEVDGVTSPFFPANLALIGIPLSAGPHVVTLSYRPRFWAVAVILGGLGLVVAVGVCVGRARGRQAESTPGYRI